MARVRFDPGVRRLTEVAWQTDKRESGFPRDWDQRNHAADAAVVLHDDAPPLARKRIDDAALVKRQTTAGIGVAVSDSEG